MPLFSTAHGDSRHHYNNDVPRGNMTDTFSPTTTTPVYHNNDFDTSSSSPSFTPGSSYTDVRRTNRTSTGNETNVDHDMPGFGPSDRVTMVLLLLGFVVLLTVSLVFSFKSYNSSRVVPNDQLEQQQQERRDKKDDKSRPTIEQARRALVQFFEQNENQMVVVFKEGDCTCNDEAGDDGAGAGAGGGSSRNDHEHRDIENDISISTRSQNDDGEDGIDKNDTPPTIRRPELTVLRRKLSSSADYGIDEQLDVSDCCTICLEPYVAGESIVWSMNSECHHVYHKDCVVDYFAYKMNKGHPCLCPTCRRTYCSVTINSKDPNVDNTEATDYDIEQPRQQQAEQ